MSAVDVKIDGSIAQFGAHRYPIANISSYRTAEAFKAVTTIWRVCSFTALLLVFCGWILVGRDLVDGNERYVFYGGFVALLALVDSFPMHKTYTYMLYIGTSGGEELAFCTHNNDEMKSIEKQLRHAISKGGDSIEVDYETSKI
jgi:Family of unknown function (DUF6232)